MLFFIPFGSEPAREAKLVRYPHYQQVKIAFTCLADTWTADERGQNIRRLTVHKARDFNAGMVIWHGMVKMTFSLDEITVKTLRQVANRLQKPQSHVLREAIKHYEPRAGMLAEDERRRRVQLFDKVVANIPSRPAKDVDFELAELSRSRKAGWHKNPRR